MNLTSGSSRLTGLLLALGALLLVAAPTFAHEVRPAYLELKETAPGIFDVLFKTPMRGDARLALDVRSIAFVALEIVRARDGEHGIAARAPWVFAFAFGLLHGLGFAGALSEIGLPAAHIPAALLFFNVGVEAGQLLFVAVVLGLAEIFRPKRNLLPRWASLAPPYLIGSLAMFWVIQRVSMF